MCVNGWESEYVCSMNGCESAYHTCSKSGTIYESATISSSVNLAWDAVLGVLLNSTFKPKSRLNTVLSIRLF